MSSAGYTFSAEGARKTIAVVRKVQSEPADGTGSPITRRHSGDSWFARITGNDRDGDDYGWIYASVEVYKSDTDRGKWTAVDGGRTSTTADDNNPAAYNTLEDMNGPSGLTGCGVNIDELPDGFDMAPVPTGAIVRMWIVYCGDDASTVEYHFTAVNQITGGCGNGAG